jgi:hypothetical protein
MSLRLASRSNSEVFPYAAHARDMVILSDRFAPPVILLREASIGMMLTPNSLKKPSDYSKAIAKDRQLDMITYDVNVFKKQKAG